MSDKETQVCPQCGYEYEPWVEGCPDCGAKLVPAGSLQPDPPRYGLDDDPRWTVVTNVPNAIMGNFVKSQLEDAGIPVLMFRSPGADIAQFSHNDFVPQDLLVPADRAAEARTLVEAAPGDEYGPFSITPVDDSSPLEPDQDWDEAEVAEAESRTDDLPEGWTMLPTEADMAARQYVRRTHGEALRGWHRQTPDEGYGGLYDEEPWEREQDSRESAPVYDPVGFERRAYGPQPRKDWVRVIYGVLLAVMSLPFILQALQSLFAIVGGGR